MHTRNIIQGPSEFLPVPQCSLGQHLYERLQLHGGNVAQVNAVTGETRTFSEILKRSLSLADSLRTIGIKSGDALTILSENSLDFCLPVLAALYMGVACAPLNPTYTEREMMHALNISKPKVVFCSEATVQALENVAKELSFIKHIVVFGNIVCHRYIPFSTLVRDTSLCFKPVKVNPREQVACILCSSGTTGLPKGVMLTHSNILYSVNHLRDPRYGNLTSEITHLGLLPFFHAYAFIYQIGNFCAGSKCVVMPKFDEVLFLKAIQDHKVTRLTLVPPLLVFLAKHPMVSQYDLSSLTDIKCGAAPISREIQEQVTKRLGINNIRQGYGMTETTLASLMTPSGENKYGSSGIVVPSTEVKVIDVETGVALGPYQKGELCFKGPIIMKGYCGDNAATGETIDGEGWLHTGDIGYFDSDNYFFIVDRVKELIKYKGFQVPPAELEAVLLSHPKIKDAAVTSVPDVEAGELPLAYVVKQQGVSLTEEEVISFVAGLVSPQKRLRGGVRFVNAIPKTASGKILRRLLKDITISKL
ncbi:luciferin 4-monooxygenase [Schistocerca nitens]|uniref:luciferin 4-monooxygenase n=1 Tax=Schistocerca nitens TaxID=7011 RepID=UPI002118731D|nr:luciferin 4-monooxygenase [Schistocerca nitens]XP_049788642.1 luciferin 4-monooxygenase [Schistocerca nitens]